MTPTERRLFLQLLGQYRDAQTVYQKALDEHLRHLLPPPMLVTNKDLVDPLVSGMEQNHYSNLYVPIVTPDEPSYLFPPPLVRRPFATYVFRDPDVNPPPEEKFEVNLVEALVGWKAWSVPPGSGRGPRDLPARVNEEAGAATMRDYLLIMRDGKTEHWDAAAFHLWVSEHQEKVGLTFQARLDQLRRYTQQDVIDWELED